MRFENGAKVGQIFLFAAFAVFSPALFLAFLLDFNGREHLRRMQLRAPDAVAREFAEHHADRHEDRVGRKQRRLDRKLSRKAHVGQKPGADDDDENAAPKPDLEGALDGVDFLFLHEAVEARGRRGAVGDLLSRGVGRGALQEIGRFHGVFLPAPAPDQRKLQTAASADRDGGWSCR